MRILNILFLLIVIGQLQAQKDTIVSVDYTKVMIRVDKGRDILPITSLAGVRQAGFFLNGNPKGQIRICDLDELFLWVNGRLIDEITGCKYYHSDEFFKGIKADTLYISFSSNSSLTNLSCELLLFENAKIIKEDKALVRFARDIVAEFTTIGLLILVALLGVIARSHLARMSYIKQRAFTFKQSAYAFVNTSFFSPASMSLLIYYSLALSFIAIYLNEVLQLYYFTSPVGLFSYLFSWLELAVIIFMLFLAKWLVVSIISALFKYRSLKDFQMFDFLNFNAITLIPVLLFIGIDHALNPAMSSWISDYFLLIFPVSICCFVVWFTLKFVNNSPHKKLVIISYLCATEIIPVLFLLGVFYK